MKNTCSIKFSSNSNFRIENLTNYVNAQFWEQREHPKLVTTHLDVNRENHGLPY